MSQTLPLFPLGTVLFPGLLLPLHIFEERYRQLVRDLLDRPEPRQFGVIAIRKGRETGVDGVSALHEIGCTAVVRRVTEYEDGRYDVVTVGAQRFALTGLDDSQPYLTGQADMLEEHDGEQAAAKLASLGVQRAFGAYVEALAGQGGTQVSVPELPDEPAELSYLVAASMIIDLSDRQALLAQPDSLQRLKAERALLTEQTSMMRSLTSMPAPGLRSSPYSLN